MPRYVDMYFDGGLNLDSMGSKTISLEDVNEGFEEMKTGALART
jgi:S-(hydroxymethyl)glutathione dehydrogenase/alcohol dehydrogenase